MAVNQLDLFQKIVDDPILNQIQDLKEKQNTLRRGVFVRYDFLQKEIDSLRELVNELYAKQGGVLV